MLRVINVTIIKQQYYEDSQTLHLSCVRDNKIEQINLHAKDIFAATIFNILEIGYDISVCYVEESGEIIGIKHADETYVK